MSRFRVCLAHVAGVCMQQDVRMPGLDKFNDKILCMGLGMSETRVFGSSSGQLSHKECNMTVQRILDSKGKGATHITPDATIAEVLQSLESQNVDALVVSDDGSRVDGIISEHDVVCGLKKFGADLLGKPVRELMTAKVICCTPGDRIENLAAVMVSKHVRHLPVVVNNKLVGIVSIRDLIRLNMQAVQSDADAMRCYIQEH